ncbi:MAG: sigma-70 family RNA polymerase sigma factor [Myxococcales bacterium]|nr:sigma-70 family RNA polymerase sigma factor [Myxococcales bacterium]HQY60052.1 sigma-70 family RNA polymerase sigma factor [Polyangiaceae bacterium]
MQAAATLPDPLPDPVQDPLQDPRGAPLDVATVFREHLPFVFRALRRLGVAEGDIDDVCQEVFVVVMRKLAEFEGRSQLRTWIYGICVRSASDYRKRAPRRREVLTDEVPEGVTGKGPHEYATEAEARDLLDRLLAELDDDKRAVFVLYEIEELPMAEVALALECPLQTAYSRLHAARRRVQERATELAAAEGLAPKEGRRP